MRAYRTERQNVDLRRLHWANNKAQLEPFTVSSTAFNCFPT